MLVPCVNTESDRRCATERVGVWTPDPSGCRLGWVLVLLSHTLKGTSTNYFFQQHFVTPLSHNVM